MTTLKKKKIIRKIQWQLFTNTCLPPPLPNKKNGKKTTHIKQLQVKHFHSIL